MNLNENKKAPSKDFIPFLNTICKNRACHGMYYVNERESRSQRLKLIHAPLYAVIIANLPIWLAHRHGNSSTSWLVAHQK